MAHFHAKYRKVLGFGYTLPLTVTNTNGAFSFTGQVNLGWWAGGTYEYQGNVAEWNISSTYRCKYDHGMFRMIRVGSRN